MEISEFKFQTYLKRQTSVSHSGRHLGGGVCMDTRKFDDVIVTSILQNFF